MLTFLHSVILADQATAGLVLEKLHGSRFEMTSERVESEEAYLGCLDARVDLIIADYRYVGVGVFCALHLVRDDNLDIPVIVVSDGIGDEAVAECMRQGAADCLLKTHLERLEGAVASAARQ